MLDQKLIGIRVDLQSINVFKTFWLRQFAFALGTISILSWYVLLIFSFFSTTISNDAVLMISYYISIVVVATILSQVGVLLTDRVKASHYRKA